MKKHVHMRVNILHQEWGHRCIEQGWVYLDWGHEINVHMQGSTLGTKWGPTSVHSKC